MTLYKRAIDKISTLQIVKKKKLDQREARVRQEAAKLVQKPPVESFSSAVKQEVMAVVNSGSKEISAPPSLKIDHSRVYIDDPLMADEAVDLIGPAGQASDSTKASGKGKGKSAPPKGKGKGRSKSRNQPVSASSQPVDVGKKYHGPVGRKGGGKGSKGKGRGSKGGKSSGRLPEFKPKGKGKKK